MYFHIEQIIHMFHYFFSFVFILVFLPRLFFKSQYNEEIERISSDFLKMSFLLVSLGYVLVIFKLFEIMSIVFILGLVALQMKRMRKNKGNMNETISNFEALIYDYFDGKYKLKHVLSLFIRQKYAKTKQFLGERFSPSMKLVGTICLLGVLLFAIYIRFYDAIVRAAPSYGNRYTTMKWVKDIRDNLLFSDGIFPQGFHVFWAALQEFTRIDTLYMAKYTGPFTQILIMIGIYFIISRLTGNRISGIVGMSVYALLGGYIDPHYWEWQVEADTRTFVYIFFLPALYFLIVYLRDMNRDAFQAMFAGMAVIALMQPIVFVYFFIGVCFISLFLFLSKTKRDRASIPKVLLACGASSVISSIPFIIGVITGKSFHPAFMQLLGADIENRFLLTAAPSVLPLVISAVAGFMWHYLFIFFSRMDTRKIIEHSLLASMLIASFYFTSFQPVQPIKIDWEASVDQYISINQEFNPRHWMVVSKDSYASIVQGRGYHMNIRELVQNYDPSQVNLTRNDASRPDLNIAPHVFIYYEKNLREVDNSHALQLLTPFYTRWDQEFLDLKGWLNEYMMLNGQAEVYYEDENIVIYHLERKQDKEEIQNEIWGEGS